MRLEKEIEERGEFWLPDNEEEKISGTLHIKQGGQIELELNGMFSIHKHVHNENFNVLGELNNGNQTTLDNCFYTRSSFLSSGASESCLYINRCFIGIASDSIKELKFNKFIFSVDRLSEWFGSRLIKSDLDLEPESIDATYQSPKNIEFKLVNGVTLALCFSGGRKSSLISTTISTRVFFEISSEKIIPFSEFDDIAYKIVNLMCFAMDQTLSIKDVKAYSPDIYRDEKRQIPISIYYPSLSYKEREPELKVSNNSPFNLESVRTRGKIIFNNWLEAYETISPTLNLYFSVQYGHHKYLDEKFLFFAQALETLHRRANKSSAKMPKNKYKSLKLEILDGCHQKNKAFLVNLLEYGNEISFSNRLNQLIEPFKDEFDDSDIFIKQIVKTRNYLTHYDKSLEKHEHRVTGGDLFPLCMKMEAIIIMHFMKILGFEDKEIKADIQVWNSGLNKRLIRIKEL